MSYRIGQRVWYHALNSPHVFAGYIEGWTVADPQQRNYLFVLEDGQTKARPVRDTRVNTGQPPFEFHHKGQAA